MDGTNFFVSVVVTLHRRSLLPVKSPNLLRLMLHKIFDNFSGFGRIFSLLSSIAFLLMSRLFFGTSKLLLQTSISARGRFCGKQWPWRTQVSWLSTPDCISCCSLSAFSIVTFCFRLDIAKERVLMDQVAKQTLFFILNYASLLHHHRSIIIRWWRRTSE